MYLKVDEFTMNLIHFFFSARQWRLQDAGENRASFLLKLTTQQKPGQSSHPHLSFCCVRAFPCPCNCKLSVFRRRCAISFHHSLAVQVHRDYGMVSSSGTESHSSSHGIAASAASRQVTHSRLGIP